MSVSLTRTDIIARMHLDDPCTCCGGKLWPPFMVWRGETNIAICGECVEHIRDGFTADLVHVAAVRQFQRHQPGTAVTLMRTNVKALEAADKAWDEANYGPTAERK